LNTNLATPPKKKKKKTNLAKLELVPVGYVDNVAGLVEILGCGVASLPLKYLGLPLWASYKAKHVCDSVI
jgi:hypothetical protein